MIIKKGDIYYADLSGGIGSEQFGQRPVLVIQNDVGNKYSPTTIVAAITTHEKKLDLPTHVLLNENCGLKQRSIVMLEQVRTIDKSRLKKKIGRCNSTIINKVNEAIKMSFFLTDV
jgi:mRNA interferase MazF